MKCLQHYWLAILLVIFSSLAATAQHPQGYFRNPLGIPMQLVSNFGEIRTDHFHMGFDLRTNQKENLPVYAAAEGYISKILVEGGGYGRSIYITHPNGYVTLYAHLNDFYPALQQFVEAKQYTEEKWEQNIEFPKDQFKVSKGQFIAYSGNTGSSQGPHLHFEIRDAKTNNNINPLLFGFPIKDELQPFIYKLFLYDRHYSTYEIDPAEIKIKGGKGIYTSRDTLVRLNSNKISFGISAEDIGNTSSFRFGIYSAELWMDSIKQFAFTLDDLNYAETRYMNASIDYKKRFNNNLLVQHLSILPGNNLNIFEQGKNGVITLKDTLPHQVTIRIKDAAGNQSILALKVQWDPSLYEQYFFTQQTIPFAPNRPHEINADNLALRFPADALYDTIRFFNSTATLMPGAISPTYQVHYPFVPLHTSYTASIRPIGIADPRKTLVQLNTGKSKITRQPTFSNGQLTASFNQFGALSLVLDTVPPVITAAAWPANNLFAKTGSINIDVKDDIGTVQHFRAELDGKWLMFSRKGTRYSYKFDERTMLGKHELKIITTDLAGNESSRVFNFELLEKLPVKKPVKKSTKKKR